MSPSAMVWAPPVNLMVSAVGPPGGTPRTRPSAVSQAVTQHWEELPRRAQRRSRLLRPFLALVGRAVTVWRGGKSSRSSRSRASGTLSSPLASTAQLASMY
eukprot:3194954-Pyramimonas_sp.AAC.1